MSARKVYVGNPGYEVTRSELERTFLAHRTVESAKVVGHSITGGSKGFGFVKMSTDEQARAAIEALNGQRDGRALKVAEAKPGSDRGGGLGSYRRGRDRGRRY